jgi:hypothetical protein
MDLPRIITDLRQYKHFIEQAILNLEAAAVLNGKRRGRPPAWMRALGTGEPEERRRRNANPRGNGDGEQVATKA